jgi:hypothetical protein
LAQQVYWEGWEGETPDITLATKLLHVHSFLDAHRSHKVVYGAIEDFSPDDEFGCLEWMDEAGVELLPRYFAERLGHSNWSDVQTYVEALGAAPWWWDQADLRTQAWRIFRDATHLISPPDR